MSETEPRISWSEETDREAGRDFVGIVVKADYPYRDENSKFEGEQMRILVRAEEPPYEKLQPIWLPPADSKGTKFQLWRDSLIKNCPQAWREILPKIQQAGPSTTAQIQAFLQGLIGMRFRFVDKTFPRPGRSKEMMNPFLVPVEFRGKGEVSEIQEEKIQL
jgi:hypothetical protein